MKNKKPWVMFTGRAIVLVNPRDRKSDKIEIEHKTIDLYLWAANKQSERATPEEREKYWTKMGELREHAIISKRKKAS